MSGRASGEEQEQNVDIEYRELNNHIRECWKYISDLLRNLLTFQIILVSLVFLSGNIIRIEGVAVSVATTQDAAKNDQANITNKPTQYHEDNVPRKISILALMAIAAVGAAGATLQNIRLFNNATHFIRRAAYIESTGWFLEDTRKPTSERTSPANTYMSENLYPGKKFNLGALLTAVYSVIAIMWCLAFWRFAVSASA
jgi:hypothetical protein